MSVTPMPPRRITTPEREARSYFIYVSAERLASALKLTAEQQHRASLIIDEELWAYEEGQQT